MKAEDFCSPTQPAPSLTILLERLASASPHSGTRFVYRGQNREYPGPLIPSCFRGLLDERMAAPERISGVHPEWVRFVRVFYPCRIFALAAVLLRRAIQKVEPNALRIESGPNPHLYDVTRSDVELAETLFRATPEADLSQREDLRERFPSIDAELSLIQNIVDRAIVREHLLATDIGRPAGDLLAQQFGLTSSFLDASLSLEVAGFFASHAAPEYLKPCANPELGVIYRFEAPYPSLPSTGPADLKSRPFLLYDDCFARWEHESANSGNEFQGVLDSIKQLGSIDDVPEEHRLPVNSIGKSRIGRQASVMIVPHVLVSPNGLTVTGVEDLRCRLGFEAFFFRHDSTGSKGVKFTRSWLWPMLGDTFRNGLSRPLTLQAPPMLVMSDTDGLFFLQRRPDIIDTGYSFAPNCKPDLAWLGAYATGGQNQLGEIQEVNEKLNLIKTAMELAVDGDPSAIVRLGITPDEIQQFLIDIAISPRRDLYRFKACALYIEALAFWLAVRSSEMATEILEQSCDLFLISSYAFEIAGDHRAATTIILTLSMLFLDEVGSFPAVCAATHGVDWMLRFVSLTDEIFREGAARPELLEWILRLSDLRNSARKKLKHREDVTLGI